MKIEEVRSTAKAQRVAVHSHVRGLGLQEDGTVRRFFLLSGPLGTLPGSASFCHLLGFRTQQNKPAPLGRSSLRQAQPIAAGLVGQEQAREVHCLASRFLCRLWTPLL
jgi:DNA helicase TIP49 (TBP-interacting protein)